MLVPEPKHSQYSPRKGRVCVASASGPGNPGTLSALVAVELPEPWRQRLPSAFPDVRFYFADDAASTVTASAVADVALVRSLPREAVAQATRLRWVQAATAGVSHLLYSEFRDREVLLTNTLPHGVPMAENVLAMMFAFACRLPLLIEARPFHRLVAMRVVAEKFELAGQTLVVLGTGDVGGQLATKASALGMHVIGLRRRPEIAVPGADRVVGVDRLREVLGQADHVAVALPLTQGTREFIGRREIAWMRRGAYLYNVGGGPTVDRAALLEALDAGYLAGAGLDVTDPDPPLPDDPLWDLPNVILTQHTSEASPRNGERIAEQFASNLRRYLRGEPLLNVVDLTLGF